MDMLSSVYNPTDFAAALLGVWCKEKAEQKKKKRADNEARMKEEAELTKKAKQEQEKAPWEE